MIDTNGFVCELYLCHPNGERILDIGYMDQAVYVLNENSPGGFKIRLPGWLPDIYRITDAIVEIWRGPMSGSLFWEFGGFMTGWFHGDNNGTKFTDIWGPGFLDLAARRKVLAYAGSAQADMTDYADDMIKEIIRDQMGADADAARDLTSVGGGFTVQQDISEGYSLTKGFAWKGVLMTCQEIAKASAENGVPIYFDIVPNVMGSAGGPIGLEFRTYTDRRGADHTDDSKNPIRVGLEYGNLINGGIGIDHSYEISHCRVLGSGDEMSRETEDVSDTGISDLSIWNWREGTVDARMVEPGDTAALQAEGYAFLQDHKTKYNFVAQLVEGPGFVYGRDFGFGDLLVVDYGGIQKNGHVTTVKVSLDRDGTTRVTPSIAFEI